MGAFLGSDLRQERKQSIEMEVEIHRQKEQQNTGKIYGSKARHLSNSYGCAGMVEELTSHWLLGHRERQRGIFLPGVLSPHAAVRKAASQRAQAQLLCLEFVMSSAFYVGLVSNIKHPFKCPLKHPLPLEHGLICLYTHCQQALHPIPPAHCLQESGQSWHHSVKHQHDETNPVESYSFRMDAWPEPGTGQGRDGRGLGGTGGESGHEGIPACNR